MSNWFEIDKKGLAKILERKGKEFAIFELIQNAWDEDGVTWVAVSLVPDTTRGYVQLTVTDNAPNGFADIRHAFTLFAESKKKDNPEKRGRFNLGEKLVLALAREAKVVTTTGSVIFNDNGRRNSSEKTPWGSKICATIRMNQDEMQTAIAACNKLIPPSNIETKINSVPLVNEAFLRSFMSQLTTEIADPEGYLVKSKRQTAVTVHRVTGTRPAAIYEMGIPVCEIDGKYSFNVGQKVPLTMDREEVLPSFKKQLAVAAVNHIHDIMDSNDANTAWATEAAASPDIRVDALDAVMTQKFGAKRVIYDPSDPEANARAAAEGYTVITGGQLSADTWNNVRNTGAALPAGQVTPSPKPYSENGNPLKRVKVVTPGMKEVQDYAVKFAEKILGVFHLEVIFAAEVTWPYAATYGPGGPLTFNVGSLGKDWFNMKTNMQAIDDLIIHEFGHEYEGNHLSENYYKALTKIGSKLAQAIRAGRM